MKTKMMIPATTDLRMYQIATLGTLGPAAKPYERVVHVVGTKRGRLLARMWIKTSGRWCRGLAELDVEACRQATMGELRAAGFEMAE